MKTFFLFGLLLLLVSCQSSEDPASRVSSPLTQDEMIDELLFLVNQHRQDRGLQAVLLDFSINEIAQEHSQNMATAKTPFGHSGFSTRCSLAREALGGGNLCLENVARGQKDAHQVFNSWINSAGHRQNIESSRVTHMGLGYGLDRNGVKYWTQLFLER
ncbi:MAG: CAP domain-containing protein [Bacteriovoracaceae bacterium]